MNAPITLNGHKVIRSAIHKNCVTVMVDKGDELIVATWWPELKHCWSWGHYFPSRVATYYTDAIKDFNETAARNALRIR